jgi:hypothetical protein
MRTPAPLSFSASRPITNANGFVQSRIGLALRRALASANRLLDRRGRREDALIAAYACNAWCDWLENRLIERLLNPQTEHW